MFKEVSLKKNLFLGGMIVIILVGVALGSYTTFTMKEQMLEQRFNELEIGLNFKKTQLIQHINLMKKDVELLSQSNQILTLLHSTKILHEQFYTPEDHQLKNYPLNKESIKIFDSYDPYFKEFIDAYNFYDLFVIGIEHGHILYSVKRESDLGESLKYGTQKNSKLADAYRGAIRNNKTYISDFALYEPSGDLSSMFICSPIHNNDGKIIGVVAIQIPNSVITDFVKVIGTEVKTKESYLVGADHLPRSNTLFGNNVNLVENAFKNPTKYIIDTPSAQYALDGKKGRFFEVDYKLHKVISVTDNIDLESISWGIVNKIDEAEIYTPIYKQIYLIVGLILIAIFLSILFFNYLFQRVVANVNLIAQDANKLNIGDFSSIKHTTTYKEMQPIANLIEDQSLVLQRLTKDVENIKKTVKKNDFSLRINSSAYIGSYVSIVETINDILNINQNTFWIKKGLLELSNSILSDQSLAVQSQKSVDMIAKYLNVSVAVIYQYDQNSSMLKRGASYSYMPNDDSVDHFKLGEGVVGQVALSQQPIHIENLTHEHSKIATATTIIDPFAVYTYPILYKNELLGVFEIVTQRKLSSLELEYFEQVLDALAIIFYTTKQDEITQKLLLQTLEQKAELETQSEELQQTNSQLEEQQQELEMQAVDLQTQNNQLEKTQNELMIKADMLEKAIKYKSEFLANVSHELRTPLNAVILLSKLIEEDGVEKIGEENLKKVAVIHKSGNDLLKLINDILDFSKIEAGKMEVHPMTFSSKDLAFELEEFFKYTAKEKGLEFVIEDNLQSMIKTDYDKLLQIIKNLLSNAFKFTSQGKVTLVIEHDSIDPRKVAIIVIDTGIGIKNEKLREVFEPFKQVDGAINRKFAGTGLGLSISKQLIELLGGKISLHSVYGEGSSFKITFPIDDLHTQNQLDSKNEQPIVVKDKVLDTQDKKEKEPIIIDNSIEIKEETKAKLHGKNILVVDDDARNIFALSSLFEHLGAHVSNAFTGNESLEILKNEKIDLVLMDIMMPEMDGYETIAKIRDELNMKTIPIIVVTAKSMKDEKEKAIKAGANDYIAKPVDFNTLAMMAYGWIKNS